MESFFQSELSQKSMEWVKEPPLCLVSTERGRRLVGNLPTELATASCQSAKAYQHQEAGARLRDYGVEFEGQVL